VLAVSGGTLAGQALVVAATPLLTRLYTPAEFGVLAAFAALAYCLVAVASLRYEMAVPLAPDDETAMNLLAVAVAAALGTAGACALAAGLFPGLVRAALGNTGVTPYAGALSLAVAGGGVYQALTYWEVRRGRFGTIGKTRFAQNVAQVGVQLSAGLAGLGVVGLVAGDVIGRAGGGGVLAARLRRGDRHLLRAVSVASMRRAAGSYRRFPLLSSWSAIVNAVGLSIPALVFGALFGAATAGLFVLAQRMVGLPLRLVGSAVAQVYLSEAGRTAHADPTLARSLFLRTARRLLLLGLVPTVIVGALGSLLFGTAFGREWQEAGTYAQLLALPFALQAVADPLSQTLNVTRRQDLQLGWDVGRLVLAWGGVLAVARLGYGAREAIAVYAGVLTAMYALLFALCLRSLSHPGPPPR
jgi:O-antigen/teichoic acid export membrane protein